MNSGPGFLRPFCFFRVLSFVREVRPSHTRGREAQPSPVVDAKLSQALSSLETRMGKDTDGKDTGGKRTPSKCESCLCTIKDEDVLALQCISGHVLCGECSPVYAESVLAQGMAAFPPKCSVCRAGIPLGSFERILKPEQVKCSPQFCGRAQH